MTMFVDIIANFLSVRRAILSQSDSHNRMGELMEATNQAIQELVKKGMSSEAASACILESVKGFENGVQWVASYKKEQDFMREQMGMVMQEAL